MQRTCRLLDRGIYKRTERKPLFCSYSDNFPRNTLTSCSAVRCEDNMWPNQLKVAQITKKITRNELNTTTKTINCREKLNRVGVVTEKYYDTFDMPCDSDEAKSILMNCRVLWENINYSLF